MTFPVVIICGLKSMTFPVCYRKSPASLASIPFRSRSIIQHERHPDRAEPTVTLVIMTHQAPEGAARKAVQQIAQLPVVHSGSTRMRVMEEG
jgi:hypothetical protein